MFSCEFCSGCFWNFLCPLVDTALFDNLVFFLKIQLTVSLHVWCNDKQKFELSINMEEVVTEINILYIYIYFRYAISTYTVSFRLNVLHLSSPFFRLASASERLSKRSMPLHKKWFLNDGLIVLNFLPRFSSFDSVFGKYQLYNQFWINWSIFFNAAEPKWKKRIKNNLRSKWSHHMTSKHTRQGHFWKVSIISIPEFKGKDNMNHWFSRSAKLYEKLKFLTCRYACVRVRIRE